MAFTPPTPQTPTSIGLLTVTIWDKPEGAPGGPMPTAGTQGAWYTLDLLDENGMPIPFEAASGDLVPHLTQAQITGLMDFMAGLHALAEQQLLGG